MLTYHDYEKKVYEWLLKKNEADPEFRFATRINSRKGSENDVFAGTENSGYFTTTFWNIPVKYPGAAVEVVSLNFEWNKDSLPFFYFRVNMPPKVEGNQNELALKFASKISGILKTQFSNGKIHESKTPERVDFRLYSNSDGYSDTKGLFKDLDEALFSFIKLVDDEIRLIKNDYPEFIAERIDETKFSKYRKALKRRKDSESTNNIDDLFKDVNYWLYAPGENARNWDEFYEAGIMGLGWDEIGDLNDYENKEEIEQAIKQTYDTSDNPYNQVLANFEFREKVKPGDVVIAKKGRSEYLGYGIVTSDYYYDKSREEFQKCRKVDWQKRGIWEESETIVLKTLTDITKYPEYVEKLKRLIGIGMEEKPKLIVSEAVNMNLNTILFGPPGTGKTYKTIEYAVKIADPEFYQEYFEDRESLKKRFNDLLIKGNDADSGQIAFCTFHQSFSYEDFVEGIKPLEPEEDDSFVKYAIQDGIFKSICRKASLNQKHTSPKGEQDPEELFELGWNDLLLHVENTLKEEDELTLSTLSGRVFDILEITDRGNLILKPRGGDNRNYTVSFARARKLFLAFPDLGNVKNIDKEFRSVIGGSNSTAYWSVLNYLQNHLPETQVAVKEEKEQKIYVLIIDEINRGNVSSIFGELITLIEDNKRDGEDEELSVILPYSKKSFKVPSNLYIIGTMNTADRSVEALDTALRRRFSFEELQPNEELIKTDGAVENGIIDNDIDLTYVLKSINNRIEKLIDKDHKIGHSYFLNVEDEAQLKEVFKNKVIPLLEEYFFGDFGKIGLVLGNSFVEKVGIQGFKFADFTEMSEYQEDLLNKPVFKIKREEEWNFTSIYE